MLAHPSLPAKTVPELIAYAKANPGKINIGSFGTGTTSHVAGELFKMTAGIEMIHVPYRGGAPMMTDLIGGQVQVAFDVLTGALSHIKSGDIRALGHGRRQTIRGASGRPDDRRDDAAVRRELLVRDRRAARHAARDHLEAQPRDQRRAAGPGGRAKLTALATTPMFFTPDEFGSYIGAEIEKWRKVVRAANVKVQ